mgnify:CR=1 FL=1
MPTRMSTSERETSSEKDAIILILKFIKTDNTVQEATIDVTEIIGTLENAGTGEDGKPIPPPEIELQPDDKIEVDKPETPPNPDGGGGMGVWSPCRGLSTPSVNKSKGPKRFGPFPLRRKQAERGGNHNIQNVEDSAADTVEDIG